jgi:hypothetical protein
MREENTKIPCLSGALSLSVDFSGYLGFPPTPLSRYNCNIVEIGVNR